MFFKCGINDVNIKKGSHYSEYDAKYYDKNNNKIYKAILNFRSQQYKVYTDQELNDDDDDSTNDTDNETEEE